MSWWRRWRRRRFWKRLGQEELMLSVVVSKQLLDEGSEHTARLVAQVAFDMAHQAVRRRMGLVSP